MNIALLRAACVCGLLVVALCALSSPAAAGVAVSTRGQSPAAGAWPVPGLGSPATVRADGRGASSVGVSDVRIVPLPATQPSGTFEWADASVGAGLTVVVGLLVAGGALVFSRRRVHGQLTAGSGR